MRRASGAARPDERAVPRIDARTVRRALQAAGMRAQKGLSQHFLADPDVLEGILTAAAPSPGRRILEIGPGLGILTEALLEAGAAVVAVEIDPRLVGWLRARLGASVERADRAAFAPASLRLIEGDILDQRIGEIIEPPFDVVANIPYHITSPILHQLLGREPRPERLVLMVQRELGERIAAPPGDLSYLAVFTQYHARVRLLRRVPVEAFEPPPQVESAVLLAEVRPGLRGGRLAPEREAALWHLVMAAFRERRKMLRNVLARQLGLDASIVASALMAARIEPSRRPQTVTVEEWIALLEAIAPAIAEVSDRARPVHPGR